MTDAPVLKRLTTLDRYLPLWIFGAMGLGLLLGRLFPALGAVLDRVQVAGVSAPGDAAAIRPSLSHRASAATTLSRPDLWLAHNGSVSD